MPESHQPQQPSSFTDSGPFHAELVPDAPARLPAALTAICIVAIVLGILGTLSAGSKAVTLAFGAQMQQAFSGLGMETEQQRAVQDEMNARVMAVNRRFLFVNSVLCASQVILCLALVASGIAALRLKALGRRLLLTMCICALAYETAQLIAFISVQLSVAPIMEEYMPRLMQEGEAQNSGSARFGQMLARFSIIVGIVIQSLWTLAKLAFYAFAARYLHKPHIRALFPTESP